MTLSGAGLGAVALYAGANGHPIVQVGNNTFRFLYTGAFAPGAVTATFAAGGWADTGGNQGGASTAGFSVIAPAQSFFIELSGGIILNAAGFTSSPLLQITADIKLEIDPVNLVFKLTFSGQMSVYGLGTVGATAGFFELDMSNGLSSAPQLWGVATLATNFSALRPYGINLYGTGTLQINTTQQVKTQTLTLAGLGPNGSNVTQTFTLQPLSFVVQLAGLASITPPGTSTPLVSLSGGFYLSINPGGLTVYATASLSYGVGPAQLTYGQATGLIIIQTGLTPGTNPGVAGYLTVGAGANLGLPGVGSLFSISGTVSVMFNTTLQDQAFKIPDAFLPLLKPGDPTTITIYGSAPGLGGGRNPNAPAGGQVYVTASIQAQITIGGALTLNGFVQISAAVDPQGNAVLQIVGAVGTQIPYLGSLSGQLNFSYYLSATDPSQNGVVGRVFLTLDASKIPGVSLSGDFVLEINTFSTAKTIQTFAVNQTTGPNGQTLFDGFQHDSAGNLVVASTMIETIGGFSLQMQGNLSIAGVATITGNVAFSLQLAGSDPGVSLIVNGQMSLAPIGSITLTDSGFRIDGQGLVARVALSIGAGVGGFGSGIGLGFSVTAVLSLNTTGKTQTLGTSTVAPGFDLNLQGTVDFLGFAQGSGSVDITIGPSGFQLMFGLQFALGPLDFTASGAAGVYGGSNPGMALSLNVSASANAEVFSITASGSLQINTTSVTELGIAPDSFSLALTGTVDLLKVIDFNASLNVFVGRDPQTGNEGYWYFNASASVSFFGLATLGGSIYLDANGNFQVSLSGQMTLGSSSFGLSGSFNFNVESRETIVNANPYYIFDLSGSASVSVNVFGISLAGVGLGFSFHAEGQGTVPITLSVEVSIHFLFFTVHKTASFTIGYLQLPAPVFLAGSGSGAPQTWSGSTSPRRSCSTSATSPSTATSAAPGPTTPT